MVPKKILMCLFFVALMILISLLSAQAGFWIVWEIFLNHYKLIFTPLILISSYLAYDFYNSKKTKLFYFTLGIVIALIFHQIEAINLQKSICEQNPPMCIFKQGFF